MEDEHEEVEEPEEEEDTLTLEVIETSEYQKTCTFKKGERKTLSKSSENIIGTLEGSIFQLGKDDLTLSGATNMCSITYDDGEWIIKCISDTVPTRMRLKPNTNYLLNQNDIIMLGFNTQLKIEHISSELAEFPDQDEQEENEISETQEPFFTNYYSFIKSESELPDPPSQYNQQYPELKIHISSTKDKTHVFQNMYWNKGNKIRIGRKRENEIWIRSKYGDLNLHHALIDYSDETGWFIKDLGSLNGTFFMLKQWNAFELQNHDFISCGQTTFKVIKN
jgi:hypothetical protein